MTIRKLRNTKKIKKHCRILTLSYMLFKPWYFLICLMMKLFMIENFKTLKTLRLGLKYLPIWHWKNKFR